MNKFRTATALLAALTMVLASGCAMRIQQGHDRDHGRHERGMKMGEPHAPDAKNPRVLVTQGRLSVDQEPLRFFKAQGKVKITWRLAENSPYSFPADGIVIETAGDEFKCGVDNNPRHFSCENRNSRKGSYKYTVKVLDNGKPLEPLDPVIVNEW